MSQPDSAETPQDATRSATTQSLLAAIVESSDDAIISKTLDGIITTWNSAAERLFGYSSEEIVGRPISLLFPADRLGEEAVILSKIRHGERVAHYETVRVAKDGRPIQVSVTISPIRNAAGRIVGASKIVHDAAERRRAQEALSDSETRHRAILEASLDGILTIDERGTVESINPAGQRLFGYSAEEVIGQNIKMLMPAPYRGEHDGYLRNYCDTGHAKIIGIGREVIGQRKDGSTFPMELAVTELRLSGRRIFTGTVHDITEHKRAERAIRESEERFHAICDTIPQMMWATRPDGAVDYFNARWYDYTGLTVEQSLGWGWEAVMHPEDLPGCLESWAYCVATGTPQRREARFKRASDGMYRWFFIQGVPVRDDQGKIKQWIGTCSDVDDQKRAIKEAAARAEAEAANRAKSEFLANMSHEIRTPMTAILGYTDELLDPEQTPSDRQNAVNVIRRNGAHLMAVINDILDLSKIEAGQLSIEKIECPPCRLLAEVTSLMRVRAKEKGLEFESRVDGQIPRTIRSDPTRLRQILINLLSNAMKFTEAGSVRLTTKLLDTSEGAPPYLRFEITDTGVGMTAEELAKLFKPFVQADSSTTRRFGGSGLGLTISQRLARALGGDITVQSAIGKGSVFTVMVETGPLAGIELVTCERAEALHPEESPASSTTELRLAGKILLAEDGLDNQKLLSAFLRKAGAEVDVADNGRIAYEKVVASKDIDGRFGVDLILMDMQMPELDGYGATAKLRLAGYRGPIVALTAHAMATDREKCLKAGCTDYLSKPVKRNDLVGMVHRHLTKAQVENTFDSPEQICAGPATEKDEEVLNKFRPAYIAQLPRDVHRILASLSKNDLDSVARLAHNLNGTAGMYHFTEISELAREIEDDIRQCRETPPIEARVRKLTELIRQVKGYDAGQETE